MKPGPGKAVVVMVLCALLGACASPPSRFYTLSADPTSAGQPLDIAVSVGPVAIPAQVDRPQIVVNEGPNQVRLEEEHRWAAPLQDAISAVLVTHLGTLLGTTRVTGFPATGATAADYRVAIEVQRFESVPGSAATLAAVWTIERARDDRQVTGRTEVRERVSGPGYDALAAAHSEALGRLSRDIADALRALARS